MDARNGWESFLTTDKRGPKLDMLNYSPTYTPRVSFVEENPFASDKSPLKLVATGGVANGMPVTGTRARNMLQKQRLRPIRATYAT